jgi:hypothetical protein
MRWRLGDLPFFFRTWSPGRVVIDIHEEHASSGACFSLTGFFFVRTRHRASRDQTFARTRRSHVDPQLPLEFR